MKTQLQGLKQKMTKMTRIKPQAPQAEIVGTIKIDHDFPEINDANDILGGAVPAA